MGTVPLAFEVLKLVLTFAAAQLTALLSFVCGGFAA